MADGNTNAQTHEPPRPKPALRSLDVMVGTWELKGREPALRGRSMGGPWGGEVGSPASFKGRFSDDDRDTITGRWELPGGGYEATMTRVK
jgi:hypothetical protein